MPNRFTQLLQPLINGFRGLRGVGNRLAAPARTQVTQEVQEVHPGGRVIGMLLYVFKDPWQVVAFVITLTVAGLLVYSGYAGIHWAVTRPKRMHGDLNIAVAGFQSLSGVTDTKVASIASQRIARVIDDEFKLIPSGLDIQVSNENMPVVTSGTEAQVLAERTNAHIVIYGDVSELEGKAQISPAFYITSRFRSDLSEITGLDGLALPVSFSTAEILDKASQVNLELKLKSTILIEFTRALTYLSSDQFDLAGGSMATVLREAGEYDPLKENEVFLLVAYTIARGQHDFAGAQSYVDRILARNSSYGRAYIAMGSLYYAQDNFDEALAWYEKALDLPDQPYSAHIQEKAHLGIGTVYTYLYQRAPREDNSEEHAIALEHLQAVIASDEAMPEAFDDELAALAYYDLGIIAQWEGRYATAKRYYKETLQRTTWLELHDRAQKRYDQLRWYFFD